MKSYTDIEQSRKLVEILPIETADMFWQSNLNGSDRQYLLDMGEIEYFDIEMNFEHYNIGNYDIPAWSLAALINIIPQEIFDGEYIVNITEGRDNKWIITYDHYEHRDHSYYGLSTGADNLVDACTDIIIKLKERNLL